MNQDVSKPGKSGFTLIEIMIVIAIIGILAAIAIPNFISHKEKGYDASANTDIKNAYSAAQTYFSDHADGTVTESILESYGFRSTASVSLSIDDGSLGALSMRTAHPSGSRTYTVNSGGKISF